MAAERLALGTVQFGLRYGIANPTERVSFEETADIIATARAAGLDTLDTAIGYGDSEARLGEIGVADWRIISKLPSIPEQVTDVAGWVESETVGSLGRLGIDRLHALLVHRPEQLSGPRGEELEQALLAARSAGLVGEVGVSVYGPGDLALAWRAGFGLVQAPLNVIDRSLIESGWADRLAAAGVEIHSRSAFLQGLLLMEERPAPFERWSRLFTRFEQWVDSHAMSRVGACVGFALSHEQIDRVVVGVDSADQLREIVAIVGDPVPAPPTDLASDDRDLIDPSRWDQL